MNLYSIKCVSIVRKTINGYFKNADILMSTCHHVFLYSSIQEVSLSQKLVCCWRAQCTATIEDREVSSRRCYQYIAKSNNCATLHNGAFPRAWTDQESTIRTWVYVGITSKHDSCIMIEYRHIIRKKTLLVPVHWSTSSKVNHVVVLESFRCIVDNMCLCEIFTHTGTS